MILLDYKKSLKTPDGEEETICNNKRLAGKQTNKQTNKKKDWFPHLVKHTVFCFMLPLARRQEQKPQSHENYTTPSFFQPQRRQHQSCHMWNPNKIKPSVPSIQGGRQTITIQIYSSCFLFSEFCNKTKSSNITLIVLTVLQQKSNDLPKLMEHKQQQVSSGDYNVLRQSWGVFSDHREYSVCCRYGFIVVPQFSSEVGFVSRLCLEAAKTVEVDGGGGGGGEKRTNTFPVFQHNIWLLRKRQ